MIKILELFGGIGSPRKALINLGIPVKAIDYVEIDEKAVKSYNSIFKKDLEYRTQDVVGYNLKPDILIHGSPCQNFSIAGKQEGGDKGSNTKSSLMWETINIINQMGEWKPKIVIWENVKNVLSKHMIHNFNLYLSEMESMGYTNSYEVLNTLDFRLPQHRERVFTISMLNGLKFNFNKLERKAYRPMSEFLEDTKEDKYIVTQPSILKKINNSNSKFKGKIYIIKDYCMTITTKQMRCPNSGVVDLGNGKYRYLTERECRRLQGYDDEDFEAALKSNPSRQGKLNGALYKQAGNSIPVPIFESIFKELFNFMEFKE
ncbi:DNA cytosine methyltransferase [uncultured Clostridium sp.]|jgi:DNA (cytosine-5-)-methyltransferase|uniref:DNA cytosine methyltransferase n=1 Tax=uncultured Clostridium sp. TaxID=59620 RepID=UPI0025EE8491|nr:DNA cytosine methyltransferase [uncultured Clostridium sp.]